MSKESDNEAQGDTCKEAALLNMVEDVDGVCSEEDENEATWRVK